jgi:hypothetical protein
MIILGYNRELGIGTVKLQNGTIRLGMQGKTRGKLTIVPVLEQDPGAERLWTLLASFDRTPDGIVLRPCRGSERDDRRLLLVVTGEPPKARYNEYWRAAVPIWGRDKLEGVETLASGWGAWEEEGWDFDGGWEEAILLVEPGAAFVVPSWYRHDEQLISWDGESLAVCGQNERMEIGYPMGGNNA